MSKPVIVERTFNAPIAKVWDAITNNDAMKKWYFQLPEFRAEVGFEFEFTGGPAERLYLHKCRIIEVIPQKKLTHSWRYEGWKGESAVTWELFEEGSKTRVRLTHSGLETFAVNNNPDLDAHNFNEGWNSIMSTSLAKFLEADRTIESTRLLNAPRELVWKMFSSPEHLNNWWGPNGFSLTTREFEFRKDGEWNFTMHGPDGTDYVNEMVFTELVPNERIVFTHGPTPRFQMFIQLADRDGKTELNWRHVFETVEDYKLVVEVFHAVEGLQQTLNRLEHYLTNQ